MTTFTPRPPVAPQEAHAFSEWHERCIEYLLTKSGLEVEREPHMMGKTPDLMATTRNGVQIVIECIARVQDPRRTLELTDTGWSCCDGNIRDLHNNIYSRLAQKAAKYRPIADQHPYVLAMFDASCLNSPAAAMDLVLSPYAPTITRSPTGRITGKIYNTPWPMPETPAALFELYPHVSGFIYSRWHRQHYYLPNPHATTPITPDPFRFAEVPDLPHHYRPSSWTPRSADVTDDFRPPPDAWMPQMHLLTQVLRRHELLNT